MHVKIDKEQTTCATMHVYRIYNLSFKDYKTIYNKRSLLTIKMILYMQSKSILIEDFNLYYAI